MWVKSFVIYVLLVKCIFSASVNARAVKSNVNSKRFLIDWAYGAASLFQQTINTSFSLLAKAECVTCKCAHACSAEQFSKTVFGFTPSERIVCGVNYWDSINCMSSGSSQSNSTIQPDIHSIVTTLAPVPTSPGCDKLCSITAVAKSISQMNPNAKKCEKGNLNTNEALPMTCCNLNTSNSWQKGAQVMPNCQSIPHYTPVAAFINNIYVPGTAGVFSGCLDNGEQGFQLIYQDCETNPELLHVSKQHKENNDPDIFYIIQ